MPACSLVAGSMRMEMQANLKERGTHEHNIPCGRVESACMHAET